MADEQPPREYTIAPEIYSGSPEDRQREQRDLQQTPAEQARSAELSVEQQGRQLVEETQRSLESLMDAIIGGQIDMQEPSMREAVMQKVKDLQMLLETSSVRYQRVERGEDVAREREQADAVSRFVQYSEELKHRVQQKVSELRMQEQRYRTGDISEEDYRQVTADHQQVYDALQREIQDHAAGIDPMSPLFQSAIEYLNHELAPMDWIKSEERLELLWGTYERKLMPFSRAYDEIRTRFDMGQATQETLTAAWEEKRGAYTRMREQLYKKRGLTPEDIATLEERARDVIRPDEPMPIHIDQEMTRPFKVPKELREEKLPELTPLMDMEAYNKEVEGLMKKVVQWEDVTDTLEKAGKLTPDVRKELLEELREYPAQLLALDEKAENPEESRERRSLVDLMTKLRERLSNELYIAEQPESPPAKQVEIEPIPGDEIGFVVKDTKPLARPASVLDEVRGVHQRVKASYAAVQHKLSEEQRRQVRTQIAQLTALVRRTELEHAVAHATEHAPALAHATLASMPKTPRRFQVKSLPVAQLASAPVKTSRGLFGMLGDAFRLK